MSTIAFGYASCTGISIVFVDALKSAGVAARVAGTPLWHGKAGAGNHNWVEVYSPTTHEWSFMEGRPAGTGESLHDPCSMWFCTREQMNGTSVYATRFDKTATTTVYPMSWDLSNREIPGQDRTQYYQAQCGRCPASSSSAVYV